MTHFPNYESIYQHPRVRNYRFFWGQTNAELDWFNNKWEQDFLQWTKTLLGSTLTNCSAANFQSVTLNKQIISQYRRSK